MLLALSCDCKLQLSVSQIGNVSPIGFSKKLLAHINITHKNINSVTKRSAHPLRAIDFHSIACDDLNMRVDYTLYLLDNLLFRNRAFENLICTRSTIP